MKIGVLADTHIPDRTNKIPSKMLEDFKSADMIIHAGDFVDITVLQELKKICPDVRAVWGNMDPQEIRRELNEKLIITVGKFKIGLMHGIGAPVNLQDFVFKAFKNDGVDMIIFGHSHQAFNEKRGDIIFFNPGSSTDTIFAPFQSYGIIEINGTIKARIVKL